MNTNQTLENVTPAPVGSGHLVLPPFFLEIAERLRTQDNRITENPMFCVQTKKRDVVPDGFSCDSVWVLDGEEVDEGTDGAEEYNIRERWETVMVAFTEEGCKEYLRQNGHNLSEPRIYVESFNRCPEMIAIRKWLLSLQNKTGDQFRGQSAP